jgi:hypothetical protein
MFFRRAPLVRGEPTDRERLEGEVGRLRSLAIRSLTLPQGSELAHFRDPLPAVVPTFAAVLPHFATSILAVHPGRRWPCYWW